MKNLLTKRIMVSTIIFLTSAFLFIGSAAYGALSGRIAYTDSGRLYVMNADGTSIYEVPLPYGSLPIVSSPSKFPSVVSGWKLAYL